MSRTAAPPGIDRREEILRAALEVFADRDFAEATTKAIAEKAGVTQGLLYFYFPGGKEELFRAAFEHQAQRALTGLDIQAELQAGGPPEVALHAAISRLIEVMDGPAGIEMVRVAMKAQMCPARSSDGTGDRYRPMRAVGEPISLALRTYLDEQAGLGTIRPVDSAMTAHLISSALLITMVRRAQPGDPLAGVPRAALVNAITDLFVHGLRLTASTTEDIASHSAR
jgi:AcrR family transcriptional regulator